MSLKPFYMLDGVIEEIKRIDCGNYTELHYEDENGSRAVIAIYKESGRMLRKFKRHN